MPMGYGVGLALGLINRLQLSFGFLAKLDYRYIEIGPKGEINGMVRSFVHRVTNSFLVTLYALCQ